MPTLIKNGIVATPNANVTPEQTAAAKNAGWTEQTPLTLVDRAAAQKSIIANNAALNVSAPDSNAIRESYRSMAQGTVDAIRSQFDKYVNEDTDAKKALETKAYLGSLAAGLSGSPTGAAITS